MGVPTAYARPMFMLFALGFTSFAVVTAWMLLKRKALPKVRRKAAKIAKIIIYPIKSCAGVELPSAECTTLGLQYKGKLRDRQFMVVDAATGEFQTARTQPRLVLVRVTLEADDLCINAPDMLALRICAFGPGSDAPRVPTQVWESGPLEGLDCGEEASRWFSAYLGTPVKLIYFDPNQCVRPVEKPIGCKYNRQQRPRADTVTMFSDGYPYHLCSESSAESISAAVPSGGVTWRHFRPNILVSECEAFAEDEWRDLAIAGTEFFSEKPCARCRLPNVDPDTGIPHPKSEPLNTLHRTRKLKQYDPKAAFFGLNLVLDGKEGFISVGDSILI